MKYNAKVFREARMRKMLTQTEVAELADVSVASVNLIELGKAGLWLKALRSIARVLDISDDDVFPPKELVSTGPPKRRRA